MICIGTKNYRRFDFWHVVQFKRTAMEVAEMQNMNQFLRFSDKMDAEYIAALQAAIYHFEGQEIGAKTISKYLSQDRLANFNLVNPYSRKVFREHLLMEVADLEGLQFAAGGAIMLATFADRTWACCDRACNFDFAKAKQKIRNALSGMDYIAVIEAAVYPHTKWTTDGKTGCLVSFHCHAVVWDSSKSKVRRHKAKIAARFEPVHLDDTKTFPVLNNLKTMKDLLKVIRYLTKMTLEGYRRKSSGRKTIVQEHVCLNADHHYRLFKFLRGRSLFDAWLAGGKGTEVLRHAKKAATKSVRAEPMAE
jgi:hypothetical protein